MYVAKRVLRMRLIKHNGLFCRLALICLFSSIAFGCAGKRKETATAADPLESYNRKMHKFNRVVNNMYLKPVAGMYKKSVPPPVRGAVGNFFSNVGEVPTTANQVLQGKPKNAGRNVLRFLVNSTLGIFGFFDVATPMGLPQQEEDLGKTLAKWGYKDSAYFVLPILGPSTVRDGIGLAGNTYMTVPNYLKPRWRNRYIIANGIHKRADIMEAEDIVNAAGVDEYALVRDAYLQRRNYTIWGDTAVNDGKVDLNGPPE